MARIITLLGVVPCTINPPIITLSPVCTKERVEMLPSCAWVVVLLCGYIWSGSAGLTLQLVPRRVELGYSPVPPPGFRQAAGLFDVTVRSLQPHSPCGL